MNNLNYLPFAKEQDPPKSFQVFDEATLPSFPIPTIAQSAEQYGSRRRQNRPSDVVKKELSGIEKPMSMEWFNAIDLSWLTDQLSFQESLLLVTETGSTVGKYTCSVKKSKLGDEPCFVIHAGSCGSMVNGLDCGTSITGFVNYNMHTLHEITHDWLKLREKSVERKQLLSYEGDKDQYYCKISFRENGNLVDEQIMTCTRQEMKNVVTESANILFQRVIILQKKTGQIKLQSINSKGRLVQTQFEALGSGYEEIRGDSIRVNGVRRTVEDGNLTEQWDSIFSEYGRMVLRCQPEKDIALVPLWFKPVEEFIDSSSSSEEFFGTKPPLLWGCDMELYAQYLERKENILSERKAYLQRNTKVRALLSDFVQAVLIKKPLNVIVFGINFFGPFLGKHGDDDLKLSWELMDDSDTEFENAIKTKGMKAGAGSESSDAKLKEAGAVGKSAQVQAPVTKSTSDTREYRALILTNKMKVICISDSTTDKAAAALSVGAGSMNDPDDLPGLAHFCEHMLFLGTEKYPVENDYDRFLSENGGSSNAHTGSDQTNFYFDVDPQVLEAALDRFAQFFISPLFTESAAEREVNAVNSEHEKNIPNDYSRIYHLSAVTANPEHPFSRFSTGNRQTLWETPQNNNVDVVGALKDYHKQSYSANVMCLAVLGKESLDTLQEMVEKLFSTVENKDVDLPRWEDNPYGVNELQKRIYAVPIQDLRELTLMFPISDYNHAYKTSADEYVSQLLGHEGVGSLLSVLKKLNWVNALYSGSSVPARGFGVLTITMEITPEGENHIDDLVEHVFQYIKMLRDEGPQRWYWEEIRDVNGMTFKFLPKQDPESAVSVVASSMHIYPLEDVLTADYLRTDFNEELINSFLEFLTPQNCRITYLARDNEPICNLTEEIYGIKYRVDPIGAEIIARWENCPRHPDLRLPTRNEFIPTDFQIKSREDDYGSICTPRILKSISSNRLWFLQDCEFKLPKAIVLLDVQSPLPLRDAASINLNNLMVAAIADALSECSYAATTAGLSYNISPTYSGHEINVTGFNQKLGVLLETIFNKITNFFCSPERFQELFEQYRRDLKNWEDAMPVSHAVYYTEVLLSEQKWDKQDCLEAMNEITLPALEEFAKEFFEGRLKLEWLIFGNTTASESQDLAKKCEGICEISASSNLLPPFQTTQFREIELPIDSNWVFKSEHHSHQSSCAALLFQLGRESTRDFLILSLLVQIAKEPFYSQLRTQEQLGYIVTCYGRRSHGSLGLQFLVQSHRHPAYVEGRIYDFINNLDRTLQEMTAEEFSQHRNALGVLLAEKVLTQEARAEVIWMEILDETYNFERQKLELAGLKEITHEDVLHCFQEKVGPNGGDRRRLAIHIISMTKGGAGLIHNGEDSYPEDQMVIQDYKEWKMELPFFGLPPPFKSITNFMPASSS